MKSRWRIALGTGVAAILLIVVVRVFTPREPEHDGRRLSDLLHELPVAGSGFAERHQSTRFAVNCIGTNAIPFLLESLQARDPGWKSDIVHWLYEKCDINYLPTLADARRERAVSGFLALGRVAEPAIPELQALVTGPDKENAYYAINALQAIGSPQTMPVIFHALTNDVAILREGALFSVGNFRSHAHAAVPLLVKCLQATENNVRANAANAIGQIGMHPAIVVPALIQCLQDSYPPVKRYAISALSGYGRDAISALPALRKIAEAQDEDVRRFARLAEVRVQCEMRDGAIIRGPVETNRIALVFTGHEFGEGAEAILDTLTNHHVRASFFLTGTFLTNRAFTNITSRLHLERHHIGPHSDQHLLYCSWDAGRTNLVTEQEFQRDLLANVSKIPDAQQEGFRRSRYLLPPFEHYNRDIADWTRSSGWTLINYTPGTRSNADYTGEGDSNFVSSQAILDSVLKREREDPHGLNGYMLLFHIGSGPGRADKFHTRLGELMDVLTAKGYEFVRVDELLRPPRDPNFRGQFGSGSQYRRGFR